MHKIGEKIITFIPPDEIEAEALEQIRNTSSMPFLFRHVAVMPDTHYGKGSTVGTVLATKGAGRKFSRAKARAQFTMEDFDRAMEGIEHRRTDILLDEIPGAYKDIDRVMENAKSLVRVDAVLKQILNAKGD